MNGDADYEWVKGKLPTYDKGGSRITPDQLGSGGARRDDGTLAAMAFDLEYVDDSIDGNDPPAAEPSFGEQLVDAAVAGAVEALVDAIDWDAVVEKAAVVLKRTKVRMVKRLHSALRRADNRPGMDAVAVAADIPEDSLEEVSPAVKAPEFRMSSAEYRERAKAVLVADAYAAWQREMLSKALIDDEEISPELLSAVRHVLEGRMSSLDEGELAAVMEYSRDSQAADGAYLLPARRPERHQSHHGRLNASSSVASLNTGHSHRPPIG